MSYQKKAAALQQLSLYSPAKINLFFRILSKREDGFHEVASLYQAVSLTDRLHISLSDKDVFTCSDSSLPMDENNLICRSLALFRQKTQRMDCFHIHLDKRIPMQAGLGGGSSNAATALWAFCKLLDVEVSLDTLMQWGSHIGSDVPFFFSQGTAYGEGKGEKLTFLPSGPCSSLWIVKPSFGLSTPKVYGAVKLDSLVIRDPKESLQSFLAGKRDFYNDLEEPAFSLSPPLRSLKEKLLDLGCDHVLLSGSGTSFFCTGAFKVEEARLHLPDVEIFSVRTLQRKEEKWYELG